MSMNSILTLVIARVPLYCPRDPAGRNSHLNSHIWEDSSITGGLELGRHRSNTELRILRFCWYRSFQLRILYGCIPPAYRCCSSAHMLTSRFHRVWHLLRRYWLRRKGRLCGGFQHLCWNHCSSYVFGYFCIHFRCKDSCSDPGMCTGWVSIAQNTWTII